MSLAEEYTTLFESKPDERVGNLIKAILKKPHTSKELLTDLQNKGEPLFCINQIESYLNQVQCKEYPLHAQFTLKVYHTGCSDKELDTYAERQKTIYPDWYKLYRINTPVNKSHRQIITILNHHYADLSTIQRLVVNAQSLDGARGRVAELVDSEIVKRYYFTLRYKPTGETKSYTLHYLPMHKQQVLDDIQARLDKNHNLEKVYLGKECEDLIVTTVARRPVFAAELAEIAGIPESTMLSYLREYESDGLFSLHYQSILKDGKNGKFIAYDPADIESLSTLQKQLEYYFSHEEPRELSKFRNLQGKNEFTFEQFVEETKMCETLAVAYLIHLRKKDKIEQLGDYNEVVLSSFKYI